MIPHTHIPKGKYKQVLSTNKQQDPNFPYQKKGEHSSAFWTEKNVFFVRTLMNQKKQIS